MENYSKEHFKMFGFNKNKDDGPLSPPVRGSWEFNFNKELLQAVKRREKLNKQLEEDGNSRKSSTNSTTSIESNQSMHSLGTPSTSHTTSPSPSPIIPVTPQFSYSPPKTLASISPPKALTTPRTQTDSLFSHKPSIEGSKSKTLPSDVNLRVETETIGSRESLALDRRGQSVFNMISMFNNVIDDDPAKLLRKRSPTVSAGQTDINSSKFC